MQVKPRLGIFSWFGYVMPLSQRVELIRQAGFDSVSLWWQDEQGYTGGQKHELPGIVRRGGLHIDHIHAHCEGCAGLWSRDEQQRRQAVNQQQQAVRDCSRHAVPLLVVHVEEQNGGSVSSPDGVDSMLRIVDEAEHYHVKIALENVWHEQLVCDLLDAIDSARLGLCYDSAHHCLYGKASSDLVRRYAKRLFSTHFSDHDGEQDNHWLPGLGVTDWHELGRRFPNDYAGCYLLEVYPRANQQLLTPPEFLQQAYQALQRMVGHLTSNP